MAHSRQACVAAFGADTVLDDQVSPLYADTNTETKDRNDTISRSNLFIGNRQAFLKHTSPLRNPIKLLITGDLCDFSRFNRQFEKENPAQTKMRIGIFFCYES